MRWRRSTRCETAGHHLQAGSRDTLAVCPCIRALRVEDISIDHTPDLVKSSEYNGNHCSFAYALKPLHFFDLHQEVPDDQSRLTHEVFGHYERVKRP